MQEVIVNVLFIAVLVVLAGTLFFDVRKKRNRMKTAEREGVELAADLNSKLPEGYVVLKDLYILTKLVVRASTTSSFLPRESSRSSIASSMSISTLMRKAAAGRSHPASRASHSRARSISRRFISTASRSSSVISRALSAIPWSRSLRLLRSSSRTQATNASLAWSPRSSPSSKNGRASHA